ncbi:MAG: GNAT family N-acetyltransferase [Candidatus Omnitrophica bacterium]|nr:GNAT family N-acetyltransferase [Candidatus Omnitrophota bacterium]
MQIENNLSFSISNSVNDILETEWNRLFDESVIEGFGYHKTLEESNLKEFSIHYLLAKRNNKLTAIIPFFTCDFSFTTLIQGKLQKVIHRIHKWFPNFLKFRLLFVGSPTSEELYIGIDKNEGLETILNEAAKIIKSAAKKEKATAILFFNLSEKHRDISTYLHKQSFASMKSFPNTVLEISASSLEDYINQLGKNTRKSLRRKLRDTQSLAQLKTEILEDISAVKDRIYELYLNNLTDSDVSFEILTPEFFTNIAKYMPDTAKYFLTYDNSNIIAFNLLFIKGDTAIDKFIGFDKELSRKYNLYYATFSYNLNYCIKNNIRFYQLGVTDYEPKVRLGAKIMPLFVYAKFMNPLVNIIAKPILYLIQPSNFDPVLKAIKY